MSEFNICNPMDNGITMEQITTTINESEDLVVALESVAAMYGIPSTNILSDPSLKNIKVEGDVIIAPPVKNVSGNAKAIIQSIGAVMDYVSQCVDDKLDNFQHDCVKKNKLMAHISREANPSKGKVISRHVDEKGNEILVYDSGLIDTPNPCCPETIALIKKLKGKGIIPKDDDFEDKKCDEDDDENYKPAYFTDEDDISIGTSLHESANPISEEFKNYENPLTEELGEEAPKPASPTDIGGGVEVDEVSMDERIDESASILDLMSRYDNTRNLGYAIMMEQGIDFVKPVVYQEADENKKVSVADISYMKFDNSHILKAVKLINEIREEFGKDQERLKKINYHELVNHKKFNQALDEMSNQFNCRLTFKVLTHMGKGPGNVATPIVDNMVKNKITISKSKGFQLNGLPIDIITYNSFIEKNVPDDPTLFGQYFVSIMCHEIFHNISSALRVMNTSISACVAAGMNAASKTKDPKQKRIVLTNLVDTIDAMPGVTIPKNKKRKLVADLAILSIFGKLGNHKVKDSEEEEEPKTEEHTEEAKETKGATNKKATVTTQDRVDSAVKNTKKKAAAIDKAKSTRGIYTLGIVSGIAMGLIGGAIGSLGCSIAGLALSSGGLFGTGIRAAKHDKEKKKYDKGDIKQKKGSPVKNNEEFYCDMFAGMYGLPPTFFVITSKSRNYTANDLRTQQLKDVYAAEKTLASSMQSSYPVTIERNFCAVKIAKETLNNKKDLDPAIRKYLEWIVDNYSSTEKLNIDTLYNKSTFDPGSAANLDHHLRKLIEDNGITITESDLSWLYEDDEEEE